MLNELLTILIWYYIIGLIIIKALDSTIHPKWLPLMRPNFNKMQRFIARSGFVFILSIIYPIILLALLLDYKLFVFKYVTENTNIDKEKAHAEIYGD